MERQRAQRTSYSTGGGNVQDIQALDATRVVLTVEVGSAAAKSLWITDGTPGGTLALAYWESHDVLEEPDQAWCWDVDESDATATSAAYRSFGSPTAP